MEACKKLAALHEGSIEGLPWSRPDARNAAVEALTLHITKPKRYLGRSTMHPLYQEKKERKEVSDRWGTGGCKLV
eukprot:892696-Pelagomonas_calceolata.AAC.14